MHEKSFRNALHRCHGLFFLHHIKTQVVKERLIGFLNVLTSSFFMLLCLTEPFFFNEGSIVKSRGPNKDVCDDCGQ